MEQLFRVVTIFILLSLSLFGFFTVMNVLFPKRVSKTQNILEQTPSRSFWIGLVNILFLLPISLLLLSLADITTGPLKAIITVPALFLLAVLLGLTSFGLLSMVNMVGERTMPDLSLLNRTFWSTLLLSLASALPFVGWFLLLPYILIIGVGAVILGFFQRTE
jgi:hypothetical protein